LHRRRIASEEERVAKGWTSLAHPPLQSRALRRPRRRGGSRPAPPQAHLDAGEWLVVDGARPVGKATIGAGGAERPAQQQLGESEGGAGQGALVAYAVLSKAGEELQPLTASARRACCCCCCCRRRQRLRLRLRRQSCWAEGARCMGPSPAGGRAPRGGIGGPGRRVRGGGVGGGGDAGAVRRAGAGREQA
jgi:hypothetical protein